MRTMGTLDAIDILRDMRGDSWLDPKDREALAIVLEELSLLADAKKAAQEERDRAQKIADIYERDWYAAKTEYGQAMARATRTIRELKDSIRASAKTMEEVHGDCSYCKAGSPCADSERLEAMYKAGLAAGMK